MQPVSVFPVILRLNTDNFVNSIKPSVFVMKTQCIFCEVGTEFLHITVRPH
jgi:hypothetical protein